MGVDLFFVLSGFLITGIRIDAKKSEGYFKNFYTRGCLRIWSLYYSAILFMFVIVPFLRPLEGRTVFDARSSPWWAFPLFLQNFLVHIPTKATGLLGVTWSLAVEEQFYVVWPLVVRFCSEAQLRKIALGVICISPVVEAVLRWDGDLPRSHDRWDSKGKASPPSRYSSALVSAPTRLLGTSAIASVRLWWIQTLCDAGDEVYGCGWAKARAYLKSKNSAALVEDFDGVGRW
jgi:hypothetical protein